MQRCEMVCRQLPAFEYGLINQIAEQSDSKQLGGTLPAALASRLHMAGGEANAGSPRRLT
ncbi:DUF222 domain-containing protein [Mycobacterium uberis]|uniref:DUF222 domain-containing protein n=1 Tax=Mycobacterium uberis TaxID=2162698 RepID=UPI001FB3871B|nr:DUF222 domain-containing protein [Mycobacterium uberis]